MTNLMRAGVIVAASTLVASLGGCAATVEPPVQADRPAAVDQYVNGYQSLKRGDTERAQKQLEGAVQRNPELLMARELLGDIYRKQNDFNAASQMYSVLSERDPYTLSNHYYLGLSYQLITRYKDATVAYLRGLKLDPKDFKSNLNIGTAYLSLGDNDQAVNYLDKATQIDAQNAGAWSNLGVALDAKDSYVLAETAYRKAGDLDPKSLTIQQNLASNLLHQNRVGESIYLWEQIVAKNKTPFTQTKLAAAYVAGTEYTRAEQILDEVLKADPRYVPAINMKARSRLKQYETSGLSDDHFRTEAVALLKQSLSLNSSQTSVANDLKKYESAPAK